MIYSALNFVHFGIRDNKQISIDCVNRYRLISSVCNLNSIPMESIETPTSTPLQLHSNSTPLHGVGMELNFKNWMELELKSVELEWEWS